mgnify:CR=1 FL=1
MAAVEDTLATLCASLPEPAVMSTQLPSVVDVVPLSSALAVASLVLLICPIAATMSISVAPSSIVTPPPVVTSEP